MLLDALQRLCLLVAPPSVARVLRLVLDRHREPFSPAARPDGLFRATTFDGLSASGSHAATSFDNSCGDERRCVIRRDDLALSDTCGHGRFDKELI